MTVRNDTATSVGEVFWYSALRTFVPLIVGGTLGWLTSLGIEMDDQLRDSLTGLLMLAGSGLYWLIIRILEVKVAPWWGAFLGTTKSPDSYSTGTPPRGQAEDTEES